MNLLQHLKNACIDALKTGKSIPFDLENLPPLEISPSTQNHFGHYQCNSAMKWGQICKQNPRTLGEQLKTAFEQDPTLQSLCQKIEVAGPGFINFTLDPHFLSQILLKQLHDPHLGIEPPPKPLKVVVDFSSPNIAKEMHVGHLRSTIIGDCLARVLSFMGHRVLRLNHVGDWGTQFGMLIAYLKESEIVSDASLSLASLVEAYQLSKQRFDTDPVFKKTAQQAVVALQSGEPQSRQIWNQICAISRKAYQEIYDRLDIDLIERGESFYQPLLAPLLQELEQQGLIAHSEGARCFYLEGFKNREGQRLPLILEKSDGGYNYATTDMAALRHRLQIEKADWLIYVTDAGQSLHFQMIFAATQKAGFYDPTVIRVDHVPFGLVLKTDGKKFQTRSGQTQKLSDVLDSAIEKAKEKIKERNTTISESELANTATILGINAIKYADLSCNRLSDYVFNEDKMLQFEGNTAAFLLYAVVRIHSIQRKLKVDRATLLKDTTVLKLKDAHEIALGLLICQFSETLEKTVLELLPNRLSDYLYQVAEKFHAFFHHCRVEGSPEQQSRLLLCEAVSQILQCGLQLLGLKPLERM